MIKVLIAEDENIIRKGIRTILERAFLDQLEFFEAEDGIEGMELYNEHLPSIVITDIKMPDCDGLKMIEGIKATSGAPPEFLVISGHSEFEYAKSAIRLGVLDYLLKPIDKEELIGTVKMLIERNEAKQKDNKKQLRDSVRLKEATKHLREQELCRLLGRNSKEEMEQIKSRLLAWDIYLNDDMYCVLVADYRGNEKEALMRFSIENVCMETLDAISQRIQFFFDEGGRMVFLIPGEDALQLRMLAKKVVQRCKENLEHYLNLQCFFGMGSPVCLCENIYQSYEGGRAALSYKIVDAGLSLMEYEKLLPGKPDQTDTDWRAVYETLVNRGVKSAFAMVMEGLIPSPGIAYVKGLERRQEELKKSFAQYLPSAEHLPEMQPFECYWSIPEWKRSMLEALAQMRQCLLQYDQQAPPKKASVEILAYIKEHATEELTLSLVAERFHYNPSYISALIKREFGKNFSKYITEVRMEQSKKLLRETHLSTGEVAANVGYKDASYFSQVFKKETGLTPQDYRNS